MREQLGYGNPASAVRTVTAVTVLFLLAAVPAGAQQEAPVIENGFSGSMRDAPTLVEKAVAGAEGPEEALLFRPTNIMFDPDGNLYVADSGQHAILVYGRDGGFKARFGREGDGPGEFRMPAVSYFSWDGELVVEDPGNQRRSFLSTEGDFLRSESLGPVFMSGTPIPTVTGEYIRPGQGGVVVRMAAGPGGMQSMQNDEDAPGLVEVIDSAGEVKLKIGTRREHENRMIGTLINRTSIAYAPPDHVVACFSVLNEIHVYNKNTGQLERIITRRLAFNPKEPEMGTRTESTTDAGGGRRTMIQAIPDIDPISDCVAVDREGRIWVLTHLTTSEAADEKEAEGEFDGLIRIEVFSLEGELLTAIPLDFAPSMIAFDPLGDLWLVDTRDTLSARRYQVRWP